jgi:alkylation response protein AidB-like acyl-CoA dehydrogenase
MSAGSLPPDPLRQLPDDSVRAVLWRFAHLDAVQRLVKASRDVARGTVAGLVASGERQRQDWTPEKDALLRSFDAAGVNAVGLDAAHGGSAEGTRNLAMALAAFELAWVDGGAATTALANYLALAPLRECGTPEQRAFYMTASSVPQADTGAPWRGAFALTEPIPYAGVETGMLHGKARVLAWNDGQEPVLQVDKRGRFITNMGFADFVTVAVDSGDERIKGSCLIVLEKNDPGTFDRGGATRKLVHPLSSTHDPVFSVQVPASRIVGGYRVVDGRIVPNWTHSEALETVFRRTRVTVGLMTAAKLLSAVEPVIRYHRDRFRGSESTAPGSARDLSGLQQKEDVLHRLIDVWTTGEAAAALGFGTARLLDELDVLERRVMTQLADKGIERGSARTKALEKAADDALAYFAELAKSPQRRNATRLAELEADELVRYARLDAVADVLSPAVKLWNTGHGATMMREAVSLMGGYGITENCPGFLGYKWMDAQLEATYEGPEAVQRRQLSVTMTRELFLAQYRAWVNEMRDISSDRPGSGACTLATAMQMWLWTLQFLQRSTDAEGRKLYQSARQGVTFPLADALCWILSARQQVLDLMELEQHGPADPDVAAQLPTLLPFLTDLCHLQTSHAAGEVGRICTELIFGYRKHPSWETDGCSTCYVSNELEEAEEVIPGLSSTARFYGDVVEIDGSHPHKAGPCAQIGGLEPFLRMRSKLDGCMTGSRLAKDRAAEALTRVEVPEALDYPR